MRARREGAFRGLAALTHHPPIHVIVPGGGLWPDGSRWIACKARLLPACARCYRALFRRLFLLESTQERTFLDGMPNGQIDLSDTLDGAYVIKKS